MLDKKTVAALAAAAAAAALALVVLERRRRRGRTAKAYLYVGTYTKGHAALPYYTGRAEGAYVVSVDMSTGKLYKVDGPVNLGENPGYAACDPNRGVVYVTNERPEDAKITACSLDPDGKLTKLGEPMAIADGAHPCWVAVEAGKALTAHYISGHVMSYPTSPTDGTLLPGSRTALPSGLHGFPGPGGPDGQISERQEGPHAHCYVPLAGRGIGLCCDLGSDTLFALRIADGTAVGRAAMRRGSGPRHVAVSADGMWAYVSTELSNEIVAVPVHVGADVGVLGEPVATASLLPATHDGTPSTASHIELSPCGQYAYVGNRVGVPLNGACADCAEGLISVIRLRPGTAEHLTLVEAVAAGGKVPRSFAVVPSSVGGDGVSSGWLVVGMQESDVVRSFAINARSGKLTAAHALAIPSPGCVVDVTRRDSSRTLPRRRLGKTNLHVSAVALGGVGLGG
jgi:6-phosphogluconolactonase